MREAISAHYANLDSALDDRRMDLAAIRKRAEDRLRNAKTDDEARAAIDEFMNAFGDGHAYVRWSQPAAATSTGAEDKRPLCERLGYAAREPRGIDFSRVAGYQPIDDPYFPGGILTLDAKRKAGVLRIRLFTETAHPQTCADATASLNLKADAQCDFMCGYRVQLAAGNLLSEALAARAEKLRDAGATMLLVDLTGNGGGSNWIEPAVRVLSPVPLQSPRLAFVKHAHWEKQLKERLNDVAYDLEHHPSPLVTEAEKTLRTAIDKASERCDRTGVWNDPPQRPDCSALVAGFMFASGLLPHAKPGSIPETWHSRAVLFNPNHYTYRESANRLPLVVLVDEGTASASEQFAAMLQDAGAAKIVGVTTRGSGCGFTNGGIQTTLKHSGAALLLPDCARLRKDGTNEVLGITPDVLVPWRRFDSAYQRARKAVAALSRP